jgi:hypothetical protein
VKRKILISLILVLGFTLPALAQTPDVYWGLDWSLTEAQVDSVVQDVFKDKKLATKTNYTDNRQLSGYSYRIAEKGIAKIYVWFNIKGKQKISINSIEILYSFDYPYDAKRFKQAYFEKYGHAFEEDAVPYQTAEGISVVLRAVKEPAPGVLGQTVYQVSMLSPNPYEMNEENMDFLF